MRRETEALDPAGGSAHAGQSINRYALLGEIAAGGMATVHLARLRGASGFERIVAVKRCHPHLRRDPHFRDMLVDEARLAAQIRHPNVVATLDVIPGEAVSVVMEYVEGGPLSELITWTRARDAQLPLEVVLRIVLDLLQGLHAAHTLQGVDGQPLALVHRDVSPQNVLVSTDGVARLADFGVAKANARMSVTREGQIKGKVPYLAPEVLLGAPITAQLDLYAVGVVFWEALTRARLFAADSESELWDQVLRGVVPAPSTLRPDLPPEIDALVLRCLSRDPGQRPASALDFTDAVERTCAALGLRIASQRTVALLAQQAFAESIAHHRALCAAPMRPTRSALPALAPQAATASRARRSKRVLFALLTLLMGGGAWVLGRAGTHRGTEGVAPPGTEANAAVPRPPTPPTKRSAIPAAPAAPRIGPVEAQAEVAQAPAVPSADGARKGASAPTRPPHHRTVRRRRHQRTKPPAVAKTRSAPAGDTLFQPDGI